MFGADVTGRPGYPAAFDLTLHLMIGVATTACLHGEEARVDTLIGQWKALFPALLARAPTPDVPDGSTVPDPDNSPDNANDTETHP